MSDSAPRRSNPSDHFQYRSASAELFIFSWYNNFTMNEYLLALQKYAEFSGRSTRREFWMFCLVHVIVTIGLVMFAGRMVANLYGLLVFLPILGLSIRRLHDTGRSGWLVLLGLIPVVGQIILIVFYLQPSKGR